MATSTQTPHSTANFVTNCLLSSAILRTPFGHSILGHNSSSKPNNPDHIRDIHNSIASAVDKCFTTLNTAVEKNPVVQKLLSFTNDLRNVCQIRCRSFSRANSLSMHNFAAILPGDSVAGIVAANGVSNFLNIYNTLLVVRLVLTWFPNSPPAIVSPLSTICDPYLNIFRGLIPPLGGTLDLSPILAFLVLNALTSTASALPAELPVEGQSQNHSSSHPKYLNLTASQQKWLRRVCGSRSKDSGSLN